jgi:hypothetical protein
MDSLKHNSEDPSRKLMHYGALKNHIVEKRYKVAEIMHHLIFYRLVKAMCGLATIENI